MNASGSMKFRFGAAVAAVVCAAHSGNAQVDCLPTFQGGFYQPTGATPGPSMVSADFNRDGSADLAMVNTGAGTATVVFLYGTGSNISGTYAQTLTLDPNFASPEAIVAADFNHDGLSDLAIADQGALPHRIFLFRNTGAESFAPAGAVPVSYNPYTLACGDFDRDGNLDLVAPCLGSSVVAILRGNGDGSFQPPLNIPQTLPLAVAVADFNGDGWPDLALTNVVDFDVHVMLNDHAGGFASEIRSYVGSGANVLAAGDFNHDAKVDLAATNFNGSGSITVLLGNGNGSLSGYQNYPVGPRVSSIALADLNTDGYLDIATAHVGGSAAVVLTGHSDGTFSNPANFGTMPGSRGVALGDATGDRRPDLLIGCDNGYQVAINASTCYEHDCNHNAILDLEDILSGASRDCSEDGIPDECQHLNSPSFNGSGSMEFDGYGDYIEVPYSASTNSPTFTAELWVKFQGALGYGAFYSPLTSRSAYVLDPNIGSSLQGYLFYLGADDHWQFWTGAGGWASWTNLTGPVAQPGEWTHLAGSYDATTGVSKFYVNGSKVAEIAGYNYTPNGGTSLRIAAGTTDTSPNYLFPGQVDDVRIWNLERSETQIAQALNERMRGDEAGLVALYRLEDLASTAADAASAAGLQDGMIYGFPPRVPAVNCAPCPGDVNDDRQVNLTDLATLLAHFGVASGATLTTGDIDADGDVDLTDLAVLLANFGVTCE